MKSRVILSAVFLVSALLTFQEDEASFDFHNYSSIFS